MHKDEVDVRLYRDEVYHCAKCHLCKSIDFHKITGERFTEICPSGHKFKFESYFSSGKMEIVRALINKELKPTPKLLEIFYTCTLCGGCEAVCNIHKELRPSEVFHSARSWLIKNKIGPLEEHKVLIENALKSGNPWDHDPITRTDWAKSLDIPPINDETEIIFFVGCFISFDQKAQEVAKKIVEIFKKSDIKFGLYGEEESCCGSPVLIIGDHQSFDEIHDKNLNVFLKYKKPIVAACSGCYNMLKNIYELKSQGIRVYHITEYLSELARKKRLKFSKSIDKVVTYHDPCHLGRHSNLYKIPRTLLKRIPGIKLVEMPRSFKHSFCCGAGGGVKKAYPDYAVETATERINEALETGAEILVTTCPFCERNFRDAGGIEVRDIVDLVLDAL